MASIQQVFRQTAIYGLGTILPRFLNYLLTPLYTYLFTNPADYGIYAELYAYMSFLNILFTYGMETTFFHFVNTHEHPNKVFNTTFSLIIISTTIFSALLFLWAPTLTNVLHYPTTLFVYWTIGILASDALLSIPFAYLRQQQKALRFSLIKVLNVFINIALNLFFFLLCKQHYDQGIQSFWASWYHPHIGIGYSLLSNLIANVLSLLFLIPSMRHFRFRIEYALVPPMLKYAAPLLIVGLAGMINETFDRLVLKYLLPLSEAQKAQGIYGACYKISILMTIFIQAYRYAAEPFFFKAFKETDAKETYAKTTDAFIAFGLFIWLATILNLPLLQYFIGPSYRIGLKVVPILLTANLCLGIYFNLSFWYKLTGQTHIGALITIFGALVTLIINFAFVPVYSYVASAWATLASYFSMMILAHFLGQKYYKIRHYTKRITLNGFSTLMVVGISSFIHTSSETLKILINNGLLALFAMYLMWPYNAGFFKKSRT